jgi:lysozyme
MFLFCTNDGYAQRSRYNRHHSKQRTHRVVGKHKKTRKSKKSKKKAATYKPTKHDAIGRLADPRLLTDPNYNPFLQCEDTCNHVHGIDLSHYQGEVFWETVGENTKMAYVYLKATEGGDRIDAQYERNIEMAHRHGLKVGSYHFFRPKAPLVTQLENFMTQCRPGEQDLIPMIDVETTGGLSTYEFCDSLFTFLDLVEKAYHQRPLIYTFRNFYNRHLIGKINDYKIMIAMYTDEEPVLADGRDITMWQYTSHGRIIGVRGNVDKSRFLGNHGLRDIRFNHVHRIDKQVSFFDVRQRVSK